MDGTDKSRFCEHPNGLFVRTAPLDGAAQVYSPTHMRYAVMMREHYPSQAGHPGANMMYTSLRRWFIGSLWWWKSTPSWPTACSACATASASDVRRSTARHPPRRSRCRICVWTCSGPSLLVILDRFSRMTRAIPLQRIDVESITKAFSDHWVAAYGPPTTALSDNGPQFRSTFFHGICSLLGIANRYSTTSYPQTDGQVERYNRTIVGQLRTYFEDLQDRWDDLVSTVTLAYIILPQQSTGMAPLELVTPERVRNVSL